MSEHDLEPANDGSLASALMGADTNTPQARPQGLTTNAKPLTRAAVQQTMAALAPRIEACGNGTPGTLIMRLVVDGPTGRVTQARPHTHTYRRTKTGRCAARIIKDAEFPSFSGARQAVKYTFQVR